MIGTDDKREGEDEEDGEQQDGAEAKAEPAPEPAPAVQPVVMPAVSLDELEQSRGFEERIGAVRGFTRDNPARAALAIRDMIKADAQ